MAADYIDGVGEVLDRRLLYDRFDRVMVPSGHPPCQPGCPALFLSLRPPALGRHRHNAASEHDDASADAEGEDAITSSAGTNTNL